MQVAPHWLAVGLVSRDFAPVLDGERGRTPPNHPTKPLTDLFVLGPSPSFPLPNKSLRRTDTVRDRKGTKPPRTKRSKSFSSSFPRGRLSDFLEQASISRCAIGPFNYHLSSFSPPWGQGTNLRTLRVPFGKVLQAKEDGPEPSAHSGWDTEAESSATSRTK